MDQRRECGSGGGVEVTGQTRGSQQDRYCQRKLFGGASMMLSVNTIYWINPAWNSWRVFGKWLDLLKKAVTAVRSGLVKSALRDLQIIQDGIIPASEGVAIEGSWTAFGTGTSVSCSITPASVGNCYMVVCLSYQNNATITSPSLQGSTPGSLAAVGSSIVSTSQMYGTISYSTTPGTFTCTLSNSTAWRVVVYQLSGVNQTTPTVDAKTTAQSGGTLAVTLTTVLNGLTIDNPTGQNGITAASNGQTTVLVNSIITAGSLVPTTTSTVVGYTYPATYSALAAVSLNPA
ncbi:MAG: hypothetical protein AB9897_01270 [Anaerolineaceae bacterium]